MNKESIVIAQNSYNGTKYRILLYYGNINTLTIETFDDENNKWYDSPTRWFKGIDEKYNSFIFTENSEHGYYQHAYLVTDILIKDIFAPSAYYFWQFITADDHFAWGDYIQNGKREMMKTGTIWRDDYLQQLKVNTMAIPETKKPVGLKIEGNIYDDRKQIAQLTDQITQLQADTAYKQTEISHLREANERHNDTINILQIELQHLRDKQFSVSNSPLFSKMDKLIGMGIFGGMLLFILSSVLLTILALFHIQINLLPVVRWVCEMVVWLLLFWWYGSGLLMSFISSNENAPWENQYKPLDERWSSDAIFICRVCQWTTGIMWLLTIVYLLISGTIQLLINSGIIIIGG